jgi:hypothetical protein
MIFLPCPYCHIVSLCALFPYRQFSHVLVFVNVDFSFITSPTTFYFTWPVVSIYVVVGNVVVKLLFASESEERTESRPGRQKSIAFASPDGAKFDGGLGHPTAHRPRCCSYIRRSNLRPKPQQQLLPFSYCRPQNTVCDGQDPLAVALPRAQDATAEETQNRAPVFHHVSCCYSYCRRRCLWTRTRTRTRTRTSHHRGRNSMFCARSTRRGQRRQIGRLLRFERTLQTRPRRKTFSRRFPPESQG